jgi:TonB family protein
MNYYEQDERSSRVWGIVSVVFYLAVCAGIMFVTHTIALPEPELGILVDFGVSDTGSGDEDLATGEIAPAPTPTPSPASPEVRERRAEPVLTTEEEDAPAVVPETRPEVAVQTPVAEPAPEPVREVDRRALFPGRTEGSASTSQGTAGGEGNQGTQEGSPGGGDSAGGSGSSGFSLAGRYMGGNLPRPAYDVEVEGRVVIRITVNGEGAVTGAVYEQTGSTTNHGELVDAARRAALRARFTPSEAEVQTGTITYIFRLN